MRSKTCRNNPQRWKPTKCTPSLRSFIHAMFAVTPVTPGTGVLPFQGRLRLSSPSSHHKSLPSTALHRLPKSTAPLGFALFFGRRRLKLAAIDPIADPAASDVWEGWEWNDWGLRYVRRRHLEPVPPGFAQDPVAMKRREVTGKLEQMIDAAAKTSTRTALLERMASVLAELAGEKWTSHVPKRKSHKGLEYQIEPKNRIISVILVIGYYIIYAIYVILCHIFLKLRKKFPALRWTRSSEERRALWRSSWRGLATCEMPGPFSGRRSLHGVGGKNHEILRFLEKQRCTWKNDLRMVRKYLWNDLENHSWWPFLFQGLL